MRDRLKYLILLFSLTLLSCGKPPFLNKSTNNLNEKISSIYFEAANLLIELEWKTPLSSSVEGIALLKVSRNGGAHILPENSEVFLWMASMGHGSADIIIKEVGAGLYELSNIYFIMDGDWQLHIKIPLNSQQSETHILEYLL